METSPEDLPSLAIATETTRLLRRMAACVAALAVLAGLALLIPSPVRAEIRRSGVAALPLSALLSLLGVLLGTWAVSSARLEVAAAQAVPGRIGRAARLPQAGIVTPLALAGAAAAWWLRPWPGAALVTPGQASALGGAAFAVAFVLLIVERGIAAVPERRLPEAPALRAVAFIAVLVAFASGLVEIASGLGMPFTALAGGGVALVAGLVGLELAARALGRLFLPPPLPGLARGMAQSVLALVVASGGQGGVAAPIRRQFGIDFSRSWALLYVRRAAVPMLLVLGLMVWGISGLVLVDQDRRAVYERFGAPVRVLHPGLHAILPWPLGAARLVEFGQTHELALGGESGSVLEPRVGAEDAAPASADRLWEQPHPGELTLLIATESRGRQGFQSVAADLRVLYRVGLSDDAAVASAYASADPAGLVRAGAGAVASAYFARRTLPDVLGANREAMAEQLRGAVQAGLDGAQSGLQVMAVIVEAIHPPAGAADAYHAVRAAEITANASIFAEQGRAIAVRAQSRQYAEGQAAAAVAAQAETVGDAKAALTRFDADRQAAAAGGPAFLAERYFAALTSALAKTPVTIVDSRLVGPAAPVLDLRQLAGAAATTTDGE